MLQNNIRGQMAERMKPIKHHNAELPHKNCWKLLIHTSSCLYTFEVSFGWMTERAKKAPVPQQLCSIGNKAKRDQQDNLEETSTLAVDLLGSDIAKSPRIQPRSQEFREQ